jgi:hypothetical protein
MSPTHEAKRSSRALLLGADWAMAHGDLGTVAYIAKRLAASAGGVLQSDLLDIAEMFRIDLDRAAHRWPLLRAQAWDALASAR